ncbi:MAG: hypothetical protein P9C48_07585 [Defluviicoccus sp.]|nr:hypothetical protein [Defluviicoccus sp.]MDG4608974.1 hypothetical protein [Defluviicoccus sp.]
MPAEDSSGKEWLRRLKRLPRPFYWAAGAAIGAAGAITGRIVADAAPEEMRIPIWLTGAALIFVGLAVVSFGTRAWLGDDEPPPP